MKSAVLLVVGALLIITPQIIIGVIAANSAWVQSSFMQSVARIESAGQIPTLEVNAYPLPSMPDWLMFTSVGLGVVLCVMGLVSVFKPSPKSDESS